MTQLEEEASTYFEWHLATPLVERKSLLLAGEPEPFAPGEVQVLLDMEDYGKLPFDGGLFDQPDFLMQCIAVCRTAREDALIVQKSQMQTERENNHGPKQRTRPN